MNPEVASVAQLNRVLDLSPATEPTFVFMIGAAGSGKSTIASKLGEAIAREDFAVAKFDDSTRWAMPRWEAHQGEFPDFRSCVTHFVAEWTAKVAAEYKEKKVVLCDVNVDPDILRDAIEKVGIKNHEVVLVQPNEEVRAMRLANDPSRQCMDRAAFRGQFESEYSNYLIDRAHHLGIPRILNEDPGTSIRELVAICVQGVRDAH